MKKENSISRRSFLKSTAMAGALGAIGTGSASVLTSCAGGGESAAANKPLKWYSDIRGIGFRVVCEPDPAIGAK